MANPMTIARAAEKAGVGVETIRFYERRGLIAQPPKPRDGGYRDYDLGTVERIRFIRQAQELGFSLREIEELLALKTDRQADCADVRMQAVAKRREVERKIGQLEEIRSALDALIATCPGGGDLSACTIMEALSHRRTAVTPTPSESRSGNMATRTTFKIDGMHCDGCARTVEAVLLSEPGVSEVDVSFGRREAAIRFDPAATNGDRLKQAIVRVGYSITGSS
ncbi:MerR family transcriptional regulator [Stappia sp. F7233]|uniref:Mercuric resistance operon regulatory protein n=1 Tax=Stappia albiluteola TaxID=2758565 RepID=A0A839A9G3_9HYPH|nr:MerR family transcriptional regulator [Stappia albiluteola]MBA5775592.1 MerR family transcriptional regulator [Stappia albiluteola]